MPERSGDVLLQCRLFRVERVRQVLPSNQELLRDVVRHPGSVVILPVIDDDHLCLIRSFRPAIDRELIELPAGTREPEEDPLFSASRELAEETGYRAARWQHWGDFFPAPGILDERMSLYVAQDLTPGPPAREAGEQITNLIVDRAEASRMIQERVVVDGKTLIGLLLWLHCGLATL